MAELIGYVASVLVAVSLTMSSILRLRLVNLAGAAVFALYGIMIGAVPVAVVNIFIVCVNIYYLVRLFGAKELFRILEVHHDDEYLNYFLTMNREDIARFMPAFDGRLSADDVVFFILRGVVPAGLFIGQRSGDGVLAITLDYVLPDYRDFKVGSFLFRQHAAFFRERGISTLEARGDTRYHAKYLERMGFVRAGDDAVFTRTL